MVVVHLRSLAIGVLIALLPAAANAAPVVIPFTLDDNQLYADVMVDGQGPFRFILDTGGADLITPALATQLGLAPKDGVTMKGTGDATAAAGRATLPSLQIGSLTLTQEPVFTLPLDAMETFGGVRVDGMIGYEFFRRFVTRFDFAARTMTLFDPADFTPDGPGIAMTSDHRNPEVDGSYDGIPGKFDIDTGAADDLTLTSPFVAANGLKTRPGKHVDVVSGYGVGGETYGRILRGGPVTLGDVAVPSTVVELSGNTAGNFAESRYAGNVGTGLLRRFVLTLDYIHGRLYLKPLPGRIDDLDTYDRAGAALQLDPAGFAVFAITSGGPAEAAGLHKGDVIVAIDGKPARDLTISALRHRLRNDPPGSIVTFHLAGGRDVHVTLRDQI